MLKDQIKRPFLRLLMKAGKCVGPFFDSSSAPTRIARALVIQFGGVGDVLRVFPLIERLQSAEPDVDVGLFTNQPDALLELYPGPRRPRLVQFDLGWGYPRKLWELARLRRAGLDTIINPTRGDGMLECATMAWLMGAPHRVGFDQDGAGFAHTHKQPFSASLSILEQNLALLKSLGIEPPEPRLRLRIPDAARTYAEQWYARHVKADTFRVVLHPWASSHPDFRAWPPRQYIDLIAALLKLRKAAVLVLGSSSEAMRDRGLLAELPSDSVHDLAGHTGLSEAAALIAQGDLFIGNDSGLLHMALAANVATVAVFGATPPVQVLHSSADAVAVIAEVPCQPCYRHQPVFNYRCDYGFRCLRTLPVDKVLREVLRRLPERGVGARIESGRHASN